VTARELRCQVHEEQEVHADNDGYECEHVEHHACLPFPSFQLLLVDRGAVTDDDGGEGIPPLGGSGSVT
jgi:hypothetical protein